MENRPNPKSEDQKLVCGDRLGQLMFVPERKAEDLAALHKTIRQSDTWGDFKERTPDREWSLLMERLQDFIAEDGCEIPPDDASFDPDSIPGYADGDWPAWPAQDMLHWMPEEVKDEYGRLDSSVLNGFFLWLDPDRKHEIASALEKQGYQCREDDNLVALAYGDSPEGQHFEVSG